MSFPSGLQVCDGLRESLVCVSKVYGDLVLAAIGMQGVTMAKTVCIVVTNDRRPVVENQ